MNKVDIEPYVEEWMDNQVHYEIVRAVPNHHGLVLLEDCLDMLFELGDLMLYYE